MDRTRGYGIQYRDASWGVPLITLGGVGWFLSLAGQILWDGLSIIDPTEESDGLRDPQTLTSGSVCLQQVVRGSGTISDCTELLYSAAGLALIVGFLSSWWNPMLKETLSRKGARAVGIAEFYQLQGLFLTVRCVIWWYLPSFASTVQMNKAAHLSLLVLATIVSTRSAIVVLGANTLTDNWRIFSLHSYGLFGSSQIPRQSRVLGISDDAAQSVWGWNTGSREQPSTDNSITYSQ